MQGTDTGRKGRMDKGTGGQLTCHLSQRDKKKPKTALRLIHLKGGLREKLIKKKEVETRRMESYAKMTSGTLKSTNMSG